MRAARLDPETLYLVDPDAQHRFRKDNPRALCRPLDGQLGCVAPDAAPGLRTVVGAG